MIEGFKIRVTSEELKKHLVDRAKYHKQKSEFYKKEADKFQKGKDDMDFRGVSNNPTQSLEESAKKHNAQFEYYTFLADHLVKAEIYQLNKNELAELEIVSYYF